MVFGIRRSIWMAGAGLVASVWLLETLSHSFDSWGTVAILGAGAVGAGNWWLQQRMASNLTFDFPTTVDQTTVETALADVRQAVHQLQQEAAPDGSPVSEITALEEQIAQIAAGVQRDRIRVAIVGGSGTGKSALFALLQTQWAPSAGHKLTLRDTPGLFNGSLINPDQEKEAWSHSLDCDLIVFVTAGDLTEPEFQALQQLSAAHKRLVLAFNKQDQYLPVDRERVLQRLQEQVREFMSVEDVVTIAAQPGAIKVRQYQPDGAVVERMEQPEPQVGVLFDRLTQILTQEGLKLVLTSSLQDAYQLKTQVQAVLNELRRARALPVVEKFQWISAGTAFASPLPALDLIATAAISAQMVLELSAIYQQKVSLQQAQTIASTLAGLLLKLGLVELCTQSVTAILKGNAVTFVAGGAVQAVSAAYLTRLAGLSLVDYFQEQSGQDGATLDSSRLSRLSQTLQALFQQNQRSAFLQSFVQQTIARLTPTPAPSLPQTESRQPSNVLSENGVTSSSIA